MVKLVAAGVLLLSVVAAAQQAPAAKQETKHLTVTTSASPAAAGRVTLAVDVAPKPAMHVYSPGQEGYIAITLTLDANPAFTAAKAKYPVGEKIYMPILKETQRVYSKPFKITQEVTRRSASEPLTIKGTLRYQACDDSICYLPTNVPVSWMLK